MKKMINRTHIEGLLYEHNLQKKETGVNSKHPGTEFISGTISIMTDDEQTNVVPIHFTYVTAVTATGKTNPNFAMLDQILAHDFKTVIDDGAERATKLRVDSAIGLNDFYTVRDGESVLVSAKRNEGGFIHTVPTLNSDERLRNTFECDMIINSLRTLEADPDNNRDEKMIVKGAIFDFKNALLPIEFSVTNKNGMAYFESLNVSPKNPVLTKVKGKQVSETIVRSISEESAFGEPSVREVETNYKDWVITWAKEEPYVWNDESTITEAELSEAVSNREIYLATVKKRNEDYLASKEDKTTNSSKATFNF